MQYTGCKAHKLCSYFNFESKLFEFKKVYLICETLCYNLM